MHHHDSGPVFRNFKGYPALLTALKQQENKKIYLHFCFVNFKKYYKNAIYIK